MRRITTELITERYILSRVYTRAGAHIPSEYERLYELLPRAVLEWKESVLELRMNADTTLDFIGDSLVARCRRRRRATQRRPKRSRSKYSTLWRHAPCSPAKSGNA